MRGRSPVDFNGTTISDAEQRIFMSLSSIYDWFQIVAEPGWQIDGLVRKNGAIVMHGALFPVIYFMNGCATRTSAHAYLCTPREILRAGSVKRLRRRCVCLQASRYLARGCKLSFGGGRNGASVRVVPLDTLPPVCLQHIRMHIGSGCCTFRRREASASSHSGCRTSSK